MVKIDGARTEAVELEGRVIFACLKEAEKSPTHPDYAPSYRISIGIDAGSLSEVLVRQGFDAAIEIGKKLYMVYTGEGCVFSKPYKLSYWQGRTSISLNCYTNTPPLMIDAQRNPIDPAQVGAGDKVRIGVRFQPKKPKNGVGVSARLLGVMLLEHKEREEEEEEKFEFKPEQEPGALELMSEMLPF